MFGTTSPISGGVWIQYFKERRHFLIVKVIQSHGYIILASLNNGLICLYIFKKCHVFHELCDVLSDGARHVGKTT